MIRPTRTWRTAAVLAAASLALAACGGSGGTSSGNGGGGGSKSSSSPSASSGSSGSKGNGTLAIGTLLPQTGDLAFLGPPEIAGVQTAVDDINAAGGVMGKDVTVTNADSGDGTPDIAGAQTDKLLNNKVDAVIGAASSSVSLSVIDKITGAGVVQFSPANTSPALDDPKVDPNNLYFRTAPSDVLQGAVMANLVIQDGFNNVAILARQDSYGELLASQVEKGIKAGGGNIATKQRRRRPNSWPWFCPEPRPQSSPRTSDHVFSWSAARSGGHNGRLLRRGGLNGQTCAGGRPVPGQARSGHLSARVHRLPRTGHGAGQARVA